MHDLMIACHMEDIPQCLFPTTGDDIATHRARLKTWTFEQQEYKCWVEGCNERAMDLHEPIKRSCVGWKPRQKVLLFTPYNCIGLCRKYHHEKPDEPSMLEVAEWMYEQHGDHYIDWLCSLPFRSLASHPLKGLILSHRKNNDDS